MRKITLFSKIIIPTGVGGMTSYLSLVSGTERVLVAPSSALPADVITDANYMNRNGQTLQDMQGQMWQR